MWLGVLGPTVVHASAPGAPEGSAAGPTPMAAKHRALLAALALQPGRPVSGDALVEAIWGADAPRSAQATLHTYLSVVRRTLEPELPARAPSRYLVSSDLGYELRLPEDALDASVFARTLAEVHGLLGEQRTAPVVVADAATSEALERLDRALALWRGEPYADVSATDRATAARARLADVRLQGLEDRAVLLLATGDASSAASELAALTAEHPLRERLWTLLAVAQARTGRQADALATLERLRRTLDDELGIDPSAAVRDLQTAILRQAPEVSAPEPQTRAGAATVAAPPEPRVVVPEVDLDLPGWPLVGRGDQLAALTGLLATAGRGTPTFAVLVGEPGAGKSRLAAEVCARARAEGALVLVGRCSQEEDAPPLWPWSTALGDVLTRPATAAASGPSDHDAERFALWEGIRLDLLRLAADRTVVLVLEDLHWADASSLRALRHLCSTPGSGRLLVISTWRRGATGTALAETAEALARRHATQLDLDGLSDADAGTVLTAVAGDAVPDTVAAAVRERTDGNPFFLVEYARLAHDERRELGDVLAAGLPRNVSDVVQRRIRQLPDKCVAAITAGAVVGREFELDLVAGALGVSEIEALDLLEPALQVRLVEDLGADRFRFTHALVRDSAYADVPLSRRERMHATLAELLVGVPERDLRAAEIARHWAAAGDRYVAKAWRAAARAAGLAMAAHAAEDASAHYRSALELLDRDPRRTPRNRWDLLVGYADACRWSTRLVEMTDALDEAVQVADGIGDPELVMGAAAVAADGSVWQVRSYGIVNETVVTALRRALAKLSTDDSEVRCRLLILLAGEAFYASRPAEVDALVEEGLAMARRLGDDRLLLSTLTQGFACRWRRATMGPRREMAIEAIELARRLGDEPAELLSRFRLASVRAGLGEMDGRAEEVARISARARELRLYFLELATMTHIQSFAAMRGDADALAAGTARIFELDGLVSLAHKEDTMRGALMVPHIWGQGFMPVESLLDVAGDTTLPAEPALTVMLLREGKTELARQVWASQAYEVGEDDWYAELHWACGAEAALELGERELGARLYERLLPLQGGFVITGTGPAHGPVDAYLAMAAAAAGEPGLAAQHADAALAQCDAWELPLVAERIDDLRERHVF